MLSLRIRCQIIEKTLEGLTIRQIAKHLGISKSAVGHVCQYFRKYRHVEKLPLFFLEKINIILYKSYMMCDRLKKYSR